MNIHDTHRRRTVAFPAALAGALLLAGVSQAQLAERPHLVGSGEAAVDASGRSIKNQRTRGVHTDDASLLGGTKYFVDEDPFLAYQLGRNLNFREFRKRDGVLNKAMVASLLAPMPDGHTAKITARNQTSCGACHGRPYATPGGGVNFAKDSGLGRNPPHYFGGGVVEMIAYQVRNELLAQLDADDSGWISAAEASANPGNLMIRPTPGAPPMDFGAPQLSGGATGIPALDRIFHVWYVDGQGRLVPQATRVDGVTTVGYNVEMAAFGRGQQLAGGTAGNFRALNPTLRAFFWDACNAHFDLQAFDPTTMKDPDGDGMSAPSLAGQPQFPVTHRPPDLGLFQNPAGFSGTDPDMDGFLNEVSEGDLDLAEWFMLNAPRPAFAGTALEYETGVQTMKQLGCTGCHVPTWTIKAANPNFAGDRRFFDLDVTWNENAERLEGEVVPLYTKVGPVYQRNFGSFEVQGFFSDMRQHDMGEGFTEIGYDGVRNTVWRTTPLWGLTANFPWGHDGASLTLRDVIMRHDGEGAASKAAFVAASPAVQEQLFGFLEKLVLYDIEQIPCDVDGNGIIEDHFLVAGVDTGPERFNPEWLFKVPLQIQGEVINAEGQLIRSFAGVNIQDAYGELLPYRKDSDSDGWPDVWDVAPFATGYKDGVY